MHIGRSHNCLTWLYKIWFNAATPAMKVQALVPLVGNLQQQNENTYYQKLVRAGGTNARVSVCCHLNIYLCRTCQIVSAAESKFPILSRLCMSFG